MKKNNIYLAIIFSTLFLGFYGSELYAETRERNSSHLSENAEFSDVLLVYSFEDSTLQGWTSESSKDAKVVTTENATDGNKALRFRPGSFEETKEIVMISPMVNLQGSSEATVTFDYAAIGKENLEDYTLTLGYRSSSSATWLDMPTVDLSSFFNAGGGSRLFAETINGIIWGQDAQFRIVVRYDQSAYQCYTDLFVDNITISSGDVVGLLDTDGDGILDENELAEDTDGDGLLNFEDADDDGDGIPTADELPIDKDTDGDGTPDYLDDTDDSTLPDNDGDGDPDESDPDDDNDGILDVDELFVDTDGDGIINKFDPDDDGDGIPTADELPIDKDTDGDGTPDYLDDTDDSPTLPDNDNDGVPDDVDVDDDNDGILDTDEQDVCSSGSLEYSFVGNVQGVRDRGGDDLRNRDFVFGDDYYFAVNLSTPQELVIESTIGDVRSARGGTVTVAGNVQSFSSSRNEFVTVVSSSPSGTDHQVWYRGNDVTLTSVVVKSQENEVLLRLDFGTASSPLADGYISYSRGLAPGTVDIDCGGSGGDIDTDGDGIVDRLDLDSDGDGCNDAVEAGYDDPDGDGILGVGAANVDATGKVLGAGGYTGTSSAVQDGADAAACTPVIVDTDGDGILDEDELAEDTDGDGLLNFEDADDDGDGIPTADELPVTADEDGDGIPDYLDAVNNNTLDTDGDGILDIDELAEDTDGDGLMNFEDADDDGDGIPTADELPITKDSDSDGIPDYLDDTDDSSGGGGDHQGFTEGYYFEDSASFDGWTNLSTSLVEWNPNLGWVPEGGGSLRLKPGRQNATRAAQIVSPVLDMAGSSGGTVEFAFACVNKGRQIYGIELSVYSRGSSSEQWVRLGDAENVSSYFYPNGTRGLTLTRPISSSGLTSTTEFMIEVKRVGSQYVNNTWVYVDAVIITSNPSTSEAAPQDDGNLSRSAKSGESYSLSVYPNPALTHFVIKSAKAASYKLMDYTGRLISSNPMDRVHYVDTGELNPGNYVLQVYGADDGLLETKKIVIVK